MSTFAPSIEYETEKTSASCYIPGEYRQILCFNLETHSPDGQDATSIALQFPSDWDVRGRQPCDRLRGLRTGISTDQRGVKRPQGIACDRGAFELENPLTFLFIPLILR
jgi:hypothetical protein